MKKKCKIAIIGSRTINDFKFIEKCFLDVIKNINENMENIEIISGGAKGVDSIAQLIAKKYGLTIIIIYPNWRKYGKSAGVKRNTEILKKSDVIIAVWDGKSKGTKDSIDKAYMLGKFVCVFKKGETT